MSNTDSRRIHEAAAAVNDSEVLAETRFKVAFNTIVAILAGRESFDQRAASHHADALQATFKEVVAENARLKSENAERGEDAAETDADFAITQQANIELRAENARMKRTLESLRGLAKEWCGHPSGATVPQVAGRALLARLGTEE